MGGPGSGGGGKRRGSGPKPRSAIERAIAGNTGTRGKVLNHPSSTAVAPVETFEPPAHWRAAAAQLGKVRKQLAFLTAAPGPSDPNPQIEELEARRDDLQAKVDALAVWRELAPSAFAARTLTRATAAAFEMLCRARVQECALSASPATVSGPNHRGMMQRVATWMKDFNLAPFGKPMYAAEQPVANPLDRFTKTR